MIAVIGDTAPSQDSGLVHDVPLTVSVLAAMNTRSPSDRFYFASTQQ